jgi:hypothetical protein
LGRSATEAILDQAGWARLLPGDDPSQTLRGGGLTLSLAVIPARRRENRVTKACRSSCLVERVDHWRPENGDKRTISGGANARLARHGVAELAAISIIIYI